jgi:hypothetical protein
VHLLPDQEIILGAGKHVHNGVADAENVEAGGGHGISGAGTARALYSAPSDAQLLGAQLRGQRLDGKVKPVSMKLRNAA